MRRDSEVESMLLAMTWAVPEGLADSGQDCAGRPGWWAGFTLGLVCGSPMLILWGLPLLALRGARWLWGVP
jgi:hypothetical protein